ncbi:hypothetical protein GGR51DRAFT_544224 [Nemania sp. FL0031]|nr:hypothetical protein GGR51DRAFT_544224 [Nemania sp. FL0031]
MRQPEWARCKKVVKYSLQVSGNRLLPSSNGFIRAALTAYQYGNHHHLTDRPKNM